MYGDPSTCSAINLTRRMCRTAPPWLEEHRRTVRIFWPASTGVGSFRSWFLLPRHWPDSGRSLFFSLRDQILSLQQRPRDMICPAAGPSSSHFGAGRGAYASAGNLTFRCQLATAGCTASSVCLIQARLVVWTSSLVRKQQGTNQAQTRSFARRRFLTV